MILQCNHKQEQVTGQTISDAILLWNFGGGHGIIKFDIEFTIEHLTSIQATNSTYGTPFSVPFK
jgi:hypothetical protein